MMMLLLRLRMPLCLPPRQRNLTFRTAEHFAWDFHFEQILNYLLEASK